MRRVIAYFLSLIFVLASGGRTLGQPIDFIVPEESLESPLSNELRSLQAIERDIAIEKLQYGPTKLDALVELGNLRLTQGKLEEAERFFEMALKIRPNHFFASKGLAMTYYQQGNFSKTREIFERLSEMYPLSDALRQDLEKVRAKLLNLAEIGLVVFEDSRGLKEMMSMVEAYFPSFTYPKLSARYRFEAWNFQDSTGKLNGRVLSSVFEYLLDHRSQVSFAYAPETITAGRSNVDCYELKGITGTKSFRVIAAAGRNSFHENLFTIRNGYYEDFGTLSLAGEINERSRILQTFSAGDLSDGNARRRFETDFLHYVYRKGVPFFSVELKISQANFENLTDSSGAGYAYWTPTDFRSAQLTTAMERTIGANWSWGLSGSLISNSFRDSNPTTQFERGWGMGCTAGYRFQTGRMFVEYANSIKDFYRERRLGLYGSFEF